MGVLGVWLVLLAAAIVGGRKPARWSFDVPGLWLAPRLVLEFLIINVLIFRPSLLPPGELPGRIEVYLPYFVIMWGWVFHRLDWVYRSQPCQLIQVFSAMLLGLDAEAFTRGVQLTRSVI